MIDLWLLTSSSAKDNFIQFFFLIGLKSEWKYEENLYLLIN